MISHNQTVSNPTTAPEFDGIEIPKEVAIMFANAYQTIAKGLSTSTGITAADANNCISLYKSLYDKVCEKYADKQEVAAVQ